MGLEAAENRAGEEHQEGEEDAAATATLQEGGEDAGLLQLDALKDVEEEGIIVSTARSPTAGSSSSSSSSSGSASYASALGRPPGATVDNGGDSWVGYAGLLLSALHGGDSAPDPPQSLTLPSTRVPAGALTMTSKFAQPLLVLVDMNGTLLVRTERVVPGHEPVFRVKMGSKTRKYYLRPHAQEMLTNLLNHPRVRLAFYTSMRRENAQPAIRALVKPPHNPESMCLFDRPFNVADPTGENEWDTMRDLDQVWSIANSWSAGYCCPFGPSNTIMIDDTPRKMRAWPMNVVVVPEYREEHVSLPDRDPSLLHAWNYLQRMLEECADDVASYVACHPFSIRSTEKIAKAPLPLGDGFMRGIWTLLASGPLTGRTPGDLEGAPSYVVATIRSLCSALLLRAGEMELQPSQWDLLLMWSSNAEGS